MKYTSTSAGSTAATIINNISPQVWIFAQVSKKTVDLHAWLDAGTPYSILRNVIETSVEEKS